MAARQNRIVQQALDIQNSIPRVLGDFIDNGQALFDEKIRPTNIPKFSEHPVKKKVKAILSLDGGGVRGLITAYILEAVEEELRIQTGIPDLKIAEAFDVVAGTSTGSLLATYLTAYCLDETPRTVTTKSGKSVKLDGSAKQAIQMYKLFAQEIFGTKSKFYHVFGKETWIPRFGIRKYVRALFKGSLHSPDGLDRVLNESFGRYTLDWLANRKKFVDGKEADVASLFIVAYDMVYRRPVVFFGDRSYGHARFLTADPFSKPYEEGGFMLQVDRKEALRRSLEHDKAYAEYVEENPDNVLFARSNTGDSQIPLAEHLSEDHLRYSRSIEKHVHIHLDKVCRCSVAAPVYLPPGKVENFYADKHPLVCCDGGVVANAPAQASFNTAYFAACAAFSEKFGKPLKRNTPREARAVKVEDFSSHMVLSIGCGQVGWESKAEKVANVSMLSYLHPRSEIGNVVEVLMSTSAQISHVNLESLFASQSAHKNYLRIQMSGNTKGDPGYIKNEDVAKALKVLDDSSEEALKMYEAVGKFLVKIHKNDIHEFVKKMHAK